MENKIFLPGVLAIFFVFSWNIYAGEDVKKDKSSPGVTFKIIGSEPQAGLYQTCRRMLVGPWVNQPEEYQGYNGFVAWSGVTLLKSGRWLLTFSSGYWHASPPLGVRAILGKETVDGFEFDFEHNRLMLDTKTPIGKPSGGGFGRTVQLDDGMLVTSYSYRGEDDKTHLEVVRWKLPE